MIYWYRVIYSEALDDGTDMALACVVAHWIKFGI